MFTAETITYIHFYVRSELQIANQMQANHLQVGTFKCCVSFNQTFALQV